jgi:hypothetical protein
MKFIEIQEFEARKMQHLIDDVSEENNAILGELEDMAIEEIKGYLLGRYDTDLVFAAKGDKRNGVIKRLVIDKTICLLWDRVNTNEKPDNLVAICEKNEEYLMNIAKGLIAIDLPTLDESQKRNTMMFGSNTRFTNE